MKITNYVCKYIVIKQVGDTKVLTILRLNPVAKVIEIPLSERVSEIFDTRIPDIENLTCSLSFVDSTISIHIHQLGLDVLIAYDDGLVKLLDIFLTRDLMPSVTHPEGLPIIRNNTNLTGILGLTFIRGGADSTFYAFHAKHKDCLLDSTQTQLSFGIDFENPMIAFEKAIQSLRAMGIKYDGESELLDNDKMDMKSMLDFCLSNYLYKWPELADLLKYKVGDHE